MISRALASSSGRLKGPVDGCRAHGPWGSNIARQMGLARHMTLDETTKSCVSVLNRRSPDGSRTVQGWSSMVERC